jgi:predicted amidohydrolase
MKDFRAAVLQLNCGSDEDANLRRTEELVELARARGADLVATPENTNFLGRQAEKVRRAQPLGGEVCRRFADLARRLRVHLLLGSFNERSDDPTRCRNTSVLFGPDGATLAVYRKIHLFDVKLSSKVDFVESDTVVAGDDCVVARTELGNVGLSICYDLRFPELYRRLAAGGAEILSVPAAFTRTTGEAHWELLLRARAVENQCFVLAPAQKGLHDDEGIRESYGHAMIVDPWGRVLAEVEEETGIAVADLQAERLDEIRRAMPVASHRRL